jgi:hypothetical protein
MNYLITGACFFSWVVRQVWLSVLLKVTEKWDGIRCSSNFCPPVRSATYGIRVNVCCHSCAVLRGWIMWTNSEKLDAQSPGGIFSLLHRRYSNPEYHAPKTGTLPLHRANIPQSKFLWVAEILPPTSCPFRWWTILIRYIGMLRCNEMVNHPYFDLEYVWYLSFHPQQSFEGKFIFNMWENITLMWPFPQICGS